jgi:hypothetical protein
MARRGKYIAISSIAIVYNIELIVRLILHTVTAVLCGGNPNVMERNSIPMAYFRSSIRDEMKRRRRKEKTGRQRRNVMLDGCRCGLILGNSRNNIRNKATSILFVSPGV